MYHFIFQNFSIYVLVKLCQYDNQTYGINQSIITTNCKKKCGCNFSNGTAIPNCKPLCKDEENPKCDKLSEKIKEYQAPMNGSNCTCTKKKCISGIIKFQLRWL